MRTFIYNLALISFSIFIFSVTASAHPHKSGEINHGPSLESYQTELSFSTKYLMPDGSKPNINIANKNKIKKNSGKKPVENKTILEKEQTQKKQKGQKK
jgi:hypothetical protein